MLCEMNIDACLDKSYGIHAYLIPCTACCYRVSTLGTDTYKAMDTITKRSRDICPGTVLLLCIRGERQPSMEM